MLLSEPLSAMARRERMRGMMFVSSRDVGGAEEMTLEDVDLVDSSDTSSSRMDDSSCDVMPGLHVMPSRRSKDGVTAELPSPEALVSARMVEVRVEVSLAVCSRSPAWWKALAKKLLRKRTMLYDTCRLDASVVELTLRWDAVEEPPPCRMVVSERRKAFWKSTGRDVNRSTEDSSSEGTQVSPAAIRFTVVGGRWMGGVRAWGVGGGVQKEARRREMVWENMEMGWGGVAPDSSEEEEVGGGAGTSERGAMGMLWDTSRLCRDCSREEGRESKEEGEDIS
jgi:hypothetical protein